MSRGTGLRPQIKAGEIVRVRPRQYKQLGEVVIKEGDSLTRCHDNSEVVAWKDQTLPTSRACQKNGKPLGPWIINGVSADKWTPLRHWEACPEASSTDDCWMMKRDLWKGRCGCGLLAESS